MTFSFPCIVDRNFCTVINPTLMLACHGSCTERKPNRKVRYLRSESPQSSDCQHQHTETHRGCPGQTKPGGFRIIRSQSTNDKNVLNIYWTWDSTLQAWYDTLRTLVDNLDRIVIIHNKTEVFRFSLGHQVEDPGLQELQLWSPLVLGVFSHYEIVQCSLFGLSHAIQLLL